jgi:hypothetical protein
MYLNVMAVPVQDLFDCHTFQHSQNNICYLQNVVSLQGKTSIIDALMSDNNTAVHIDEDARTVGIVIKKWKPYPDAPAGNQASLTFSVLDLAGQAIYALSHQVSLAYIGFKVDM